MAVACTLPAIAPAQTPPTSRVDRVQWLQQHAAPIRSTDPADDDFSDLAPLGAAIGKARVVMLGEANHYAGTTFLAKTRVIKYLHERLGFDVLAFESGFYDVPKAWSFLRGGEDPRTAVSRGVFGIWTGSAQMQPLIEYLGEQVKSAHPLELTGFDCQFTATASRQFFGADLRAFLASHGIDTTSIHAWPSVTQMLDGLINNLWADRKLTKHQFAEYMASWTDVRRRVDQLAAPDSTVAYWKQLLKSTAAAANAVATDLFIRGAANSLHPVDTFASYSLRDAQMAENLLWLAQHKYPDRKIIVWAHTYHVMRNPDVLNRGLATRPPPGNVTVMGDVVSGALHNNAYAIGFIFSEGVSAADRPIPPPPVESLDAMLASTTHENAFVDLRSLSGSARWLRQPLISGALEYGFYSADWTQVLDGMMYTRRMTRSSPYPPPAAEHGLTPERSLASWVVGGSLTGYRVGADETVARTGVASGHITSNDTTRRPGGMLAQSLRADAYQGKRVRFSAYVRTKGLRGLPAGDAGLWMRVDGASVKLLDMMANRSITEDVDWTRCEIVLDVPQDALGIVLGLRFRGNGEAWFDDAALEIVGEDVPVTMVPQPAPPNAVGAERMAQQYRSLPQLPSNLGFEQRM